MKKNHLILVFIFLLLVPYLCSLTIIGIGYNALVLHATSVWRSLVGALVGSCIMFAIKGTVQRPVDLLAIHSDNDFLKQLLRFFSIRRRPWLQLANAVFDFILCLISMYLVRIFLSKDAIVGTSAGWVLLVMFVSTCIGAFIEYDNLSVDRN